MLSDTSDDIDNLMTAHLSSMPLDLRVVLIEICFKAHCFVKSIRSENKS